ncbi:MAG: FMN-binding protein [Gemmatimonadota bacterium]|nr:FMN-binding protein [Gemmatimonadota bacterium]
MSHRKRSTNNLVALGSAAVVAVYAAGYVRTADAAQKFNDASNQRRRPAPDQNAPSPAGVVTAGTTRDARTAAQLRGDSTALVAAPQVGQAIPPVALHQSEAAPSRSASNAGAVATTATIAQKSQRAPANRLASAPLVTPTIVSSATTTPPIKSPVATTATAAAATVTSAAAVIPPAATPIAPVVTVPPTSAAVPPVAPVVPVAPDAAAKAGTPTLPALPPGVKWRDGSFSGWGTSRHGDIQATVEVDGGKITYVAITQCLTQYSCSFVQKLPQQVLDRQSPEVDSVSGATQSANAFYYAIVQALSKAK